MSSDRLNVIALISGGKDSFYSLLHCIHHGHRVVALANLFPAEDASSSSRELQVIDPESAHHVHHGADGVGGEKDLNSFMYQTVGHEIIPLYAAATGLPLYRQPILGDAVRHERDYDFSSVASSEDETESMSILLRAIMERHPEANAVSAGAILSTYQRTRVESVALRLGLTPLAFLWKYPILPAAGDTPPDDAQLLRDMAAAGLEARIIKVASAGLGEEFLWNQVTSVEGAERIKRSLRKFGAAKGAALGEGGEFETLVVDGPPQLFRKKISVSESSMKVVQEGGGSSWLMLQGAELVEKEEGGSDQTMPPIQTPELLELRFQAILDELTSAISTEGHISQPSSSSSSLLGKSPSRSSKHHAMLNWAISADKTAGFNSIDTETAHLVERIRDSLSSHALESHHILNTVIILRRMSDFPKVNAVYGQLFAKPNPPSRVTISCGDLLPESCNIAIFLTVDPLVMPGESRQGLHVQSRSYWAPANIGPYSQAIGNPVLPQSGSSGLQTWSIAGQIPLIPSTMVLPSPSDTSNQTQIVLSLQHLWRIAIDRQIQFWTSAVAFFARSKSEDEIKHNAELAGRAWRLAHRLPDDDDDADDGPDPWDLKYNPQYMSLGTDSQSKADTPLPDWSVLTLRQQNEAEACIPPFFAVEVEELPRGSSVEWHAHLGLAQVDESSVEVLRHDNVGSRGWNAWHTVAKTQDAAFLHTVVALESSVTEGDVDAERLSSEAASAWGDSLRRLNVSIDPSTSEMPYLTYLDAVRVKRLEKRGDAADASSSSPLIPCRSIWSTTGKRWSIICLYRTLIQI